MDPELKVLIQTLQSDVSSVRAELSNLRRIVWGLTIAVAVLAASSGVGSVIAGVMP